MYRQKKDLLDIVKIIIEEYNPNLNLQDQHGKTVLLYAIEYDNPKLIQLLLDYGANPKIKDKLNRGAVTYTQQYITQLYDKKIVFDELERAAKNFN